jgi:hypothetical protein
MKDIIGYEGIYLAHEDGKIWSNIYKRFLTPSINTNGYVQIKLWKDGKYKYTSVHRAIATAFIPNPDNKKEVNHINGIKHDNRVENLEWTTRSENIQHAANSGLWENQKNKTRERSSKKVRCVETGEVFTSMSAAGLFYGKSKNAISTSIRDNCRCAGYHWEYV